MTQHRFILNPQQYPLNRMTVVQASAIDRVGLAYDEGFITFECATRLRDMIRAGDISKALLCVANDTYKATS